MAEDKKLHIVMFPWLAFGHMLPFLELSKRIAQKGHFISFISTPRNIERLPKIPPNLSPLLNLVKLTLPHVDNLPNNAESTTDLRYNEVQFLSKAFDELQTPLSTFIQNSSPSPDWIIYDFASYWVPQISKNLGIPCAFFSIFRASSMAFIGTDEDSDDRRNPEDFTVPPKWITFPSTLAFRLHEIKRMMEPVGENASGVSDWHRFRYSIIGCDIGLARSCMEIESEWFRLLEEDIYRKPVFPVGLLPPSVQESNDDENWGPINKWLNQHEEGSVIYVALGTEVTLNEEEITELALGLEMSGLPFFWVLRKASSYGSEPIELPSGFEERIGSRGLVWSSWAPQVRILAHGSVGGFLNHSGWSSIIEGLKFGRALILMPFYSDQGLVARLFEEKKIGLEMPRDEKNGSFTRDTVAQTLRLVMVDKEGLPLRNKAKEMMRELFVDDEELHDQYLDKFITYLQTRP